MKILISTGYYNTKKFAGINVGLNIAQSFIQLGHEVELVGETTEETFDDSSSPVKINRIKLIPDRVLKAEHHLNKYLSTSSENQRKAMVRKYVFQHPINSLRIALYKNQGIHDRFYPTYAQSVEKLIRKEHFDVLICVVYPFDMAKDLLLKDDLPCIKIYYQLDPYGTSYALPPEQTEDRKKLEAQVILHSDIAIITHELLDEYSKDPFYNEAVKKTIPFEFPAFLGKEVKIGKNVLPFDRNVINILYCGTLDGDNVRDTKKTIEVFKEIFQRNEKIQLYFLGDLSNEGMKTFAKNNAKRVHVYQPVQQEDALATMYECDFLLNIGNSLPNMVPSKIFTYFSIGKPILSFEKSKSAPENRYFERYPLKHIIYNDDNTNQAVESLLEYIVQAKNSSVKQDEVLDLYKENTTDYTVKEILKLIEKAKKQ